MGGIFEWFDHLLQELMWRNLLERLSWVDFVTCFFVIAGIVYGIKRGLFAEFMEMLMTALALDFSVRYFDEPATSIITHFNRYQAAHPDTLYSRMVAAIDPGSVRFTIFVLVSATALILFYMVLNKLKKYIHTTLVAWVRAFGGATFGVFHFLILWSWIAFSLCLLSNNLSGQFRSETGSLTGPFIKELPHKVQKASQLPFKLLG